MKENEIKYEARNGPVIITSRNRAQKWIMSESQKSSIVGLISILNVRRYGYNEKNIKPLFGARSVKNYRQFTFNDEEEEGEDAPQEHHVHGLLMFGEYMNNIFLQNSFLESKQRVILHCRLGQSRSTAAAIAMYAQALGAGNEKAAWEQAKAACECNYFSPNTLILQYADQILGRNGNLVSVKL